MNFQIYSYGPGFNNPSSLDPECIALMANLKFLSIEFTLNEIRNPNVSPNGQLPFLLVQGEPIVGRLEIQKFLISCGHDLDSHLNSKERIQSLAFQSLIRGKLYDALLHTMWIDPSNLQDNTFPAYMNVLGFIPRFFVPYRIRDMARQRLVHYSTRLQDGKSTSQVYDIARDCYRSLSLLLGDKDYFFGSRPSTLDAIAYGHLCIHSYPSFKNSQLFISLAFEAPNLVSFVDRIQSKYFSMPIPKSACRPSTRELFYKFLQSPWAFIKSIFTADKSIKKGDEKSEEELKKMRVERFYNGLCIVFALGFFTTFTTRFGILRHFY